MAETPQGDYGLIDFGAGRKLERWSEIVVDNPDRLASGVPAHRHWSTDWMYVVDLGRHGHREPAHSSLSHEWTVTIGDQPVFAASTSTAVLACVVVKLPVPVGPAAYRGVL